MKFSEINNQSNLVFNDISSEAWREYEFDNKVIHIDEPLALNVSKNGHRVIAADEVVHYIPKGWVHLSWRAKEGEPHIVM